MSDQEYYYNGDYVTIFAKVADHPDLVIVTGGQYSDLMVVRETDLVPKEESYQYKQALKKKAELEAITAEAQANMNAIADKIVDKALIALASRLKFNAVFGKDTGGLTSWAVVVSQELEKMVKEKAPDVISKKKNPFE